MGFWERATTLDLAETPLDLHFFRIALRLYAADAAPVSVFEAAQLAFEPGALVEVGALLAAMPAAGEERTAWLLLVEEVLQGARLFSFEQLDSIAKCKALLGVAP